MNKKILKIIAITIFFVGCVQNQIPKTIPKKNLTLLKKYGITKNDLIYYKNFYYFCKIEPEGIVLYKLDNKYHLIFKKHIESLINPKKYLIKNNQFYILGYDNVKERPIILDFSIKNFKLIKTIYLGKKYSLPADFFVNKQIYTAINVFNPKTNSDIYIYKNTSLFSKIASPKKESIKFILPFNNSILTAGSIYYTNNYDILLILINKKGQIVWARRIDLGMDDYPTSIYIKNNIIILHATSTDEMGAQTDYTFKIDKNGNILKATQNLKFKELPIKFRT